MNLIIAPAGDKSLHKEWLKGNPEFDLVLLYYGDNKDIAKSYTQDTSHVYASKGFKWWLTKAFIDSNLEWVSKYEYIWFPDDDLLIDTANINRLFQIAKQYKLSICQPSLLGHASHQVTLPQDNYFLRYTNFVEVMAPCMDLDTVMKVKKTFDANYSSWGYDHAWPYLLGYPKDKIAIIDIVRMVHTKPTGNPALYSQIPHSLEQDTNMVYEKYCPNIIPTIVEYTQIPL